MSYFYCFNKDLYSLFMVSMSSSAVIGNEITDNSCCSMMFNLKYISTLSIDTTTLLIYSFKIFLQTGKFLVMINSLECSIKFCMVFSSILMFLILFSNSAIRSFCCVLLSSSCFSLFINVSDGIPAIAMVSIILDNKGEEEDKSE